MSYWIGKEKSSCQILAYLESCHRKLTSPRLRWGQEAIWVPKEFKVEGIVSRAMFGESDLSFMSSVKLTLFSYCTVSLWKQNIIWSQKRFRTHRNPQITRKLQLELPKFYRLCSSYIGIASMECILTFGNNYMTQGHKWLLRNVGIKCSIRRWLSELKELVPLI